LSSLLAGIGVAIGTLGAFVASRLPGGLFHFQERGFRSDPQSAVAVVAEAIAIGMLVAAIVTRPSVTRHAQQ